MKFKPLHDRVLIEVLDSSEKTAGGIIIPDTAQEKPQEGKVIAVGGGGILESVKVIRVRVTIAASDIVAVAFKNALLAQRGSIQQAHDVLNWIQTL